MTECQAEQLGLGDRWQKIVRRRERRQSKTAEAAALLERLRDAAGRAGWSARALAKAAGLPRTTLGRWLRSGSAAAAWLPALKRAAARLGS